MSSPNEIGQTLSVGELSKRSGVPVSAIHFYEEKGLIKSWRTEGNQRRFPRGMLRVVAIIKAAQSVGFSLLEIAEMLKLLPQDRSPSQADWQKISTKWKKDLEERITHMTKLKNQLNSCIGCGCLSLKECPLRNPKDRLAKKGPGAALL
ncbi:redox-sensitive transcriptional activator SoxR [Bdellovibrio bacteriovorus]|uniref:redox-sensitive transcriptional activator SoxR n=1 Tax=Bdellovibrio bacteriovorus TaxID=959 RepID=UPI0035A5761A